MAGGTSSQCAKDPALRCCRGICFQERIFVQGEGEIFGSCSKKQKEAQVKKGSRFAYIDSCGLLGIFVEKCFICILVRDIYR